MAASYSSKVNIVTILTIHYNCNSTSPHLIQGDKNNNTQGTKFIIIILHATRANLINTALCNSLFDVIMETFQFDLQCKRIDEMKSC